MINDINPKDLINNDQLTYGDIQVVKGNVLRLLKKYKIDVQSPYGQTWMKFIKELEHEFLDAYDRAMRGL